MDATLQAEKRDGRGKNEARRLRATGRIPAVVYGAEKGKAVEIAVDPKTLMRILHSESGVNTLIGLQIDGGNTRVLVKEYQLDPVTRDPLHADFYRVAMDKPITVTVSIVLKGEPKGVKQQDGILDFVQREVEIECLPGDIPEHIEIDVSDLALNEGVRLRDGSIVPAELLVLATGYKNQQETVRRYLGDAIADRVGPVWGFDAGGELCNMWRRTAQPGLWFTAGSLAQCRIFSRYLALQIKALEEGLLQ